MSPNSKSLPSGSRGKAHGFRLALVAALILLGVLCVRIARDLLSDDLPALELPEAVRTVAAEPTPPAAPAPRPAVPKVAPAAAATNVPTAAAAAPATNAAPVPVAAPVRKPADDVPAARQVRLANRTRKLPNHARPFPGKFAESQTPSARGTVPYVVVSEFPVSDLVREEAVKLGVRVLGFMPVNALLVEADAAGLKRLEEQDVFFAGAFELEPVDKVQRLVWERSVSAETVDVAVVPLAPADLDGLVRFVEARGGTLIRGEGDDTKVLRATVPVRTVDALAGRGDVRWIEACSHAKLHNDLAVNAGLMNVRPVWELHGLTGKDQILSTSDSGVDTGKTTTMHADLKDRILSIKSTIPFTGTTADSNGHGTHTAGSIVGTGAKSNGQIKGTAYGAKLCVSCVTRSDGTINFNDFSSLFQPSSRYKASIHSASWGDDTDNSYTTWCGSVDDYVWRNPTFLPVFSAGNSGTSGAGSVGTPATAKNCLAVGATETARTGVLVPAYADNASQCAYFSSRGPTADGRIKPDICAPGSFILSTRSSLVEDSGYDWGTYAANTNYAFMGGTSMACPLVAGSAALVREWLMTKRGYSSSTNVPTAALIKAVLLGGAHDMSKDRLASCGGPAPNGDQGWGRIDLAETLYPSNRTVRLADRIPFSSGSVEIVRLTVTNAAPLEVQLVWIDYPATDGAALALVNDLDLVVSNETTGAVWYGNGVTGGDHTNTVESVRLALSAPGRYAVHVKGVQVPYASTEGGAAALYLRGAFVDEGEDATPVYTVKKQSYFPLLDDWGAETTAWYPSGTVVRVSVPDDLPDGAETLTNFVWTDNATGRRVALDDQKLAEIEVSPADRAGYLQYDDSGRMATAFDVTVDRPIDVRFRYYSETNVASAAGLPDWWWRRYLYGATAGGAAGWAAGDADGDGVTNLAEYRADTDPLDAQSTLRILSFSPQRLVWQGGRACTQVVERAAQLGSTAVWKGVYTNLPPTDVQAECPLGPTPGLTHGFYRLRVLGR